MVTVAEVPQREGRILEVAQKEKNGKAGLRACVQYEV